MAKNNPADVKAFTARQLMAFVDTIVGGNAFDVPEECGSVGGDDANLTADVIKTRITERVEYLRKRLGCAS